MTNTEPTQEQAREAAREALGLNSMADFIEQFSRMYHLLLGETPSPHQVTVWYRLHPPLRLIAALLKTSQEQAKQEAGTPMSLDHQIRFLSKAANKLKSSEEAVQKLSVDRLFGHSKDTLVRIANNQEKISENK